MEIPEGVKQKVNEIYSEMLPIVNGEKEGHVDEDDLCFIESWWAYFFKKGERIDAYLEETKGKLNMVTLNEISRSIKVGAIVDS